MKRLIALIFIVVVVVGAAAVGAIHRSEVNAADEASTNYENAIAACEAGNPVREAVVLATRTAQQTATAGNERYREAAEKILAAPHVTSTGARDCQGAIKHP